MNQKNPIPDPLRIPTVLPLILAVGITACTEGPSYVGSYQLELIDGVSVADAFPDRTEVPPSIWTTIEAREGEVWVESETKEAHLEVLEEGDYRETKVSEKTAVMSPKVYWQMMKRLPPSEGMHRESMGIDTVRLIGEWKVSNDSLILIRTGEQVGAQLAAGLREFAQDSTEEWLRKEVDRVLDKIGIDTLRQRGYLEGNRLTVRDVDDRELIYRKTQTIGGS